jgi:hypothetical protein
VLGAICLVAVFAAAEGRGSLDECSDENSTLLAAVVVLLSLGVSFLRFGIGVPTGIGLLVARVVPSTLVLDVAMLILRTFLLGVAGRACVVTDVDLLSSRRDELLFFFPGEGDSVAGDDLFSGAYSTSWSSFQHTCLGPVARFRDGRDSSFPSIWANGCVVSSFRSCLTIACSKYLGSKALPLLRRVFFRVASASS